MNKTKISLLSSGLAVIAGLVVVSCKPEEINNVNGPVVDGNGNTYVTTECITPVRYVEGSYTASSTGVSVKMDDVSSNNIRFTCEPGTDINSFLVQVYPLGTFYNTLLEAMKAEGKTSLTVNDTNDYIAQAVRLTGEGATSGGVLYSRADLGDDFNSVEIDLASSSIIPYRILPGVDYIVIVQACFDDEATRYGDLAICHVEATPKDVSGDVTVGVQLTPSINSVGVTLTPGSDCEYVIYHGNYQSEIDEYINAYGDEMYHDLLCHSITQPQSVDGLDLDFRISDLTPESDYCVSAVAFDAAMTPAARITRADCALKTVPEDAEDGECTIEMPTKYAATIAVFDVVLHTNCLSAYYLIVPKTEADEIMALTGAEREAKVNEIKDGGWGVERPSTRPVGSTEYIYPDVQNDLKDNTEYAFVYVTRNEYGQISDLKLADGTFTTKILVKDRPEDSIEDAVMEIINPTRTALTLKFTYDPDKTAVIMHRNAYPIVPDNNYHFPSEISDEFRYDTDRKNEDGSYQTDDYGKSLEGCGWLYYFYDFKHNDPYQTRWPDFVNALAIRSFEPVKVSGYDADHTYKFAYIAEDVNGVVGHVKTCTGTTLSAEGGSNPQIESITYELKNGDDVFRFNGNDDITTIYYMVARNNGSNVASSLMLSRLQNKNPNDYEGIKATWTEYVVAQGLSTTNPTSTYSVESVDSDLTVAIAYAYGAGETHSELATLIIDGDGKQYTLEEWYGLEVQYMTISRY